MDNHGPGGATLVPMRLLRWVPLFVLLVACDGPAVTDGGVDAGAPTDAGSDANLPPPRVMEDPLPAEGALQAGVATVRIPAPLGIGTSGNGPFGVDPNPTPFSDMYPGTTRQHAALLFRAVVLSRGDAYEVVFVRSDTIGIFQQLREAVLAELEDRMGRSLDDALIIAANHTHSGPGRVLMTEGALTVAADTFFPEYYDRVVDAIADAVEMAYADRAPAEIGLGMARTSEAHNDRRCENDSLDQIQESPDMPLIAVRREGRVDAIVASYGYHGTTLGLGDLNLSGDMGGVVEQRVAERYDHPVQVLFFNSWGADMQHGSPPEPAGATGPRQPDGYDQMERVGTIVADVIEPEVAGMTFSSEVFLRSRVFRVALNDRVIGYPEGLWRYPNGGLFCGGSGEGNCVDSTRVDGLLGSCVPLGRREMIPQQTVLMAGQIGDLRFVTAPGEWTTALAASVLDDVRARSGGEAMFIGYANDYTGYSTSEEDWYQGGYETSGAIWGPGQGDYLAARLMEAYETYHDRWVDPFWYEPEPVPPFTGYEGYEPYVPEAPVGLGTITADVAATATGDDIVTFTVSGSDPWLGNPIATLERTDGTVVTRPNGEAVTSELIDLWMDLAVEPTYVEMIRAPQRTFSYTFSFPVTRRAGTSIPALSGGDYRFRVSIPTDGAPMEITTGAFHVD